MFKKKYQLSNTKTGAVGRFQLEGMNELLSELKENLGDWNDFEEIIDLFSKYYTSSKYNQGTYVEIFRLYKLHLSKILLDLKTNPQPLTCNMSFSSK